MERFTRFYDMQMMCIVPMLSCLHKPNMFTCCNCAGFFYWLSGATQREPHQCSLAEQQTELASDWPGDAAASQCCNGCCGDELSCKKGYIYIYI